MIRRLSPILDKDNTVVVLNKSDKGDKTEKKLFDGFKTVVISAKENLGEEDLAAAVKEISGVGHLDPAAAVLLSERQRDLAFKAQKAISEAEQLLKAGYTIDAVGVCVDDALAALYTLDGKRVTNEEADEVFRRFCVGK